MCKRQSLSTKLCLAHTQDQHEVRHNCASCIAMGIHSLCAYCKFFITIREILMYSTVPLVSLFLSIILLMQNIRFYLLEQNAIGLNCAMLLIEIILGHLLCYMLYKEHVENSNRKFVTSCYALVAVSLAIVRLAFSTSKIHQLLITDYVALFGATCALACSVLYSQWIIVFIYSVVIWFLYFVPSYINVAQYLTFLPIVSLELFVFLFVQLLLSIIRFIFAI